LKVSTEPFSLVPWYINAQRVMGLIDPNVFDDRVHRAQRLADLAGRRDGRAAYHHALVTGLVEWLRATRIPSLGEMLVRGTLEKGVLFTHFGPFHFKGLSRHGPPIEPFAARGGIALPNARSKLGLLAPGLELTAKFSPEHLLTVSSWEFMAGRQTMLLVGAVDAIDAMEVRSVPFAFGMMINDYATEVPSSAGRRWGRGMEVVIEEIDTFARAARIRVTKKDVELLREIREEDVKNAFAEIIGEPFVRKDWGGETSDLFSDRVQLDGRRIATAFAFKGKAKFQPMTPALLGKNGDQIVRLFSEPAELLILQHCHQITSAVRAQMRAFATRPSEPKMFCVIDGADTVRVLRAYKKCGL
jgi:hypothetical protein